jgi:hypothetical protein
MSDETRIKTLDEAEMLREAAVKRGEELNLRDAIEVVANHVTTSRYNVDRTVTAEIEGLHIECDYDLGMHSRRGLTCIRVTPLSDKTLRLFWCTDQTICAFREGPWVERILRYYRLVSEENERKRLIREEQLANDAADDFRTTHH